MNTGPTALVVGASGWFSGRHEIRGDHLRQQPLGAAAAGLGEALRARCDALRAAGVVVHDVDSGDAGAIAEIAASLAAKGITGRLIAIVGDKLAANVDVPELRRAVAHSDTRR